MLFVCRPKFCISIVSSFSWGLQWSQEKTKTMLMLNLGGQTKSIMVFSELAYFTPIDARSSLYSFLFLLQTGLDLFTCFSFAHPISMFPMLKKLKPKAFLHIPFMYNVVPISAAAVTESVPPNCKEEPGSFSPLSSTSPFTGTSNSIVNPRLGNTDPFPYLTLMLKEKEKELIWSIRSDEGLTLETSAF